MSEVQDDEVVTFQVTVKYVYEVTGKDLAEFYKTRNLSEAAEIDRKNLLEMPEFISEDITQYNRPIEVQINTLRVTS